MKTPIAGPCAAIVLSLIIFHPVQAAVIAGEGLNIGVSNTLEVGSNHGAIGEYNHVGPSCSLAIGQHNTIDHSDNENSSLAVGTYNIMVGYSSFVTGSGNVVYDGGSITGGCYNFNNAPCSLVIGTGNVAEYNPHANAIMAGKYSAMTYNKPAHLVIGNGTSSNNRKNSFVVYADGDIVIAKPQGDISMGIYGD